MKQKTFQDLLNDMPDVQAIFELIATGIHRIHITNHLPKAEQEEIQVAINVFLRELASIAKNGFQEQDAANG